MGDNPYTTVMGPLYRLRERIEQLLHDRGLKLVMTSFTPGETLDAAPRVQIVAVLGPSEPSAVDEQFDNVIREARLAELEQQSQAAYEDLKRSLRDDGFL